MEDLSIFEVSGKVRTSGYYGEEHWTEGPKHIGFNTSIHVCAPNADEAIHRARCHWHYHYGCLCQIRGIQNVSDSTLMPAMPHMQLSEWSQWHRDIQWGEPWWKQKMVAFDVETTGLNVYEDRIIEIGWSVYDPDEKDWSAHSQFVHPEMIIPEEAVDYTGITNEMVEDAPVFDDIACQIGDALSGCILIAHNRGYDVAMLQQAMRRAGVRYAAPPTFCTLELSWETDVGQGRKNSLDVMCDKLDISLDQHHRAGYDAQAAGRLLFKLAKHHEWMRHATARDLIEEADNYGWPSD